LNAELFIARRITFKSDKNQRISGPIVNIAILGIAIGLAVMILSVAIITGFKDQVSSKVIGFGSHIQITNFDANNSFETQPIDRLAVPIDKIKKIKGIQHAQVFITKSGIIKTNDDIQAVVLKGIDKDFDWTFLKAHLVDGDVFVPDDTVKSNRIFISDYIARLLNLKVGDKITVYFVQDPPRMRPFIICGTYKTSIEDFDKVFALVDMRHLQKLNGWEPEQVSGYEIMINDFNNLSNLTDSVFFIAGNQFTESGTSLKVTNIKERYPQIFDWLNLQDVNVWIILVIMMIVVVINMISGLLILILERTNMIGLLKGLGYDNWRIQKIFLIQAFFLIAKGLFWGNLIGIGACLLQQHFGIVPLNEATYYMTAVPINIKWIHLILLNLGTLVTTLTIMLLPSLLISYISPAKAIKFN
jgi:lipoprotein-releasing system permease protein